MPHSTNIVSIINVTPDSFSDGGRCMDAAEALKTIARHIKEGADVIDIGAESTRPGATPQTPEEEWTRLAPVLQELKRFEIPFSIDTRHSTTAEKALSLGAHWINDVSGFASPDMVQAVKKSDCRLVVMHSLTVPADKHVTLPPSTDIMSELLGFAQMRIAHLEAAGIARQRIIFDPGIGFGKTAEQSRKIIREIKRLALLEVPILVGHSRKSFLDVPPDASLSRRDAATLAVSEYLAREGVQYLRVHNVAAHRRMLEAL